ncbi:gamma-glutamyltransferase family protein [Labrys monachus]|uniref:Gamma-glutamyltranspeptidase/glutathione hydrolase n=1 Tax=Labrys monachus TaxID=217067 RepID=A0ABU0FAS9_9HYPH|nr:gamma-glutamyltransferase [Labrys monachus]MDQ0391720.1 gamma-glutamyltranspeptidase/glutathione hydrolase [Labrys monachus]
METPAFGHAAVAAPHQLACETGQRILIQGGNAIEAMIAMAATVGVVYPHMNSLGGDGFWLVTDTRKRVRFIQACGPAGAGATIAAYRELGHDTIPARGALAALTVPGAVGGWQVAREMAKAFGGQLPLELLLEDAIRHAREGVPVSPSQARVEPREYDGLKTAPGFADAFMKDGKPLAAGETMKQPALAGLLEQLVHAGLEDFYRGDVGREIAADLDRAGSFVTREDLQRFEARVREPLGVRIEGATLYNGPPPTQGLSALIIMSLFERLGVKRGGGFEHIHGLVEAIKRATAVRDRVIADPAIMTVDPASYLTPAFLDREAGGISMTRAGTTPLPGADGDTIWMGAIDRDGIAVSYIQSVFWDYGSGMVLPRTGLLMQNRGMSFSLDPRALNPLAPGRLPFHTLSPATALFDDGRVMPYGTMGGDAQPQILAQTFSRFRFGASLAEALDAPRFILGRDASGKKPVLRMENRFDEGLLNALDRAGHPVAVIDAPYADSFGHSGALVRHPASGRIDAAHDPRSDGGALGV